MMRAPLFCKILVVGLLLNIAIHYTIIANMAHVFSFILLLAALVAVLFASHFFLYYSLVHFFKIVNPGINTALAVILILLAVSFIVSSLLAHWRENIITRTFYFASGIWLGLLINLLIALFFAWVIWGAVRLSHISLDPAIIAAVAVLFAIGYSIWGIYNAYNPVVTEIKVKIDNLPTYWQGKKVVQISDIHLGHIFDKKYLKQIVDQVNSLEPEAVFITGDLFDGMDGRLDTHVEPIDNINASSGSYFVTGNHEIYYGIERATEILSKTKVKILSDEAVEVEGLRIVGLSYADRFASRDLTKIILNKIGNEPQMPTILLYHSPDQIDEIKSLGIVDLHLVGHTHAGQLFPFNYITKMIYMGYDYGLHQDGKYSLYTTSGVGSWGPTMRTGNKAEIVLITFE